MASDWQIIDACERLREEFARRNPGWTLGVAEPNDDDALGERIVEAWIQAMDGRIASAGAGQRRLRAIARAILEPQREIYDFTDTDQKLITQGRSLNGRLEQAEQPATRSSDASIGEEIQVWQRTLPGLSGLRTWRFLERMGRPVAVPESGVRRMLWRLGLLDNKASDEEALLAVHDALTRISQLTGIPVATLGQLARWGAVGDSGWKGGGWCGPKPRCGECPMQTACPWAKFTTSPAGDAQMVAESPPARSAEPFRRQVSEGRLDELQETELLALLLPAKVAGVSSLELAESLMRRFGGMRGLERAGVAELARVRGISAARAVQLKAAIELGRRVASRAFQPGDPIRSSEDVWRAYKTRFRTLPQEHFVIVLLDAKNRVMQDHIVSKGTLTGSLAHPREVFHQAVKESAAAVILLHNHPSGDPAPSPEDREVTRRLREAGEILGIRVLDHIILGADDYYSFKDEE